MKELFKHLQETVRRYLADDATMLAASLAYSTLFALAPLLVIAVAVAGIIFGQGEAKQYILEQATQQLGTQAAQTVQGLLKNATRSGAGIFATLVSVAALFFSASSLFIQLKNALNKIWQVEDKQGGGVKNLIRSRLTAFALVLGVGLVLLAAIILSTVLSTMGSSIKNLLPGSDVLWQAFNILVFSLIFCGCIAVLYRFLPAAPVSWRHAWVGALFTTLLFALGRFALAFYISRSATTSVYGAAGSVMALLLWIYYSAQIFLLGAEFTRVYGDRRSTLTVLNGRANTPVQDSSA